MVSVQAGIIVTVTEGRGLERDPVRQVWYFYSTDYTPLCRVDSFAKSVDFARYDAGSPWPSPHELQQRRVE